MRNSLHIKFLNIFFVILSILASFGVTFAQKSPYAIGSEVQDFTYRNIQGEDVKLSTTYGNSKGVIIVFTCNTCPYSLAYEPRIIALHSRYAPLGVPVLAINPNVQSGDTEDKNMRRIILKRMAHEYVMDNVENPIYQSFGATKTPEAFILKRKDNKFILIYRGAIDDNYGDIKAVNKKYVENAVDNLIRGLPVLRSDVRGIGCTIKR